MDDLKRAYYETLFKTRYLESTGDTFQAFFSTMMELRYPGGDFVRVRPWGKFGDRKNDGYLRSKRMLFQCYAPSTMDQAKCIKKIKEDFANALPHWRTHFDKWVFTHNDRRGLTSDVLQLLLALSETNKPLTAMSWGYTDLLLEYKQLRPENIEALLGPAPGTADVVAVGIPEVQSLLDHIQLLPEPLISTVHPVPAGKLQYNQLSQGVATLLTCGMSRAPLVEKYLRSLMDQTRQDRLAASFRQEYSALKARGLSPDDTFLGLQRFVQGPNLTRPSKQAAALAVLAFFFGACEIFERPPNPETT